MIKVEISKDEQERNAASHRIGNIDDCLRCVDCEIGVWNAWKEMCNA